MINIDCNVDLWKNEKYKDHLTLGVKVYWEKESFFCDFLVIFMFLFFE